MSRVNSKLKVVSGFASALVLGSALVAYSVVDVQAMSDKTAVAPGEITGVPGDVIARVGNEEITYSQLSTMLNSSAMVGLSVPALGTERRNHVIITLLDKAISANLLYLDAKQKGIDKSPAYIHDIKRFEEAILASLYQSKIMIGDIPVSEDEINTYYKSTVRTNVELTDDVRLAIESMIRKQKLKQLKSSLRERLRADVKISINEAALDPAHDDDRTDSEIIANIDNEITVVWSDIREMMEGADRRATNAAFFLDNDVERLKRLDTIIDTRLMASKGRKAGLEKDEAFIKRTQEYRKTRLVNLHRGGLIHSWNPSEDELKDYFVENMDQISVPEARKLQMVVVETEAEARAIRKKIDDGEITLTPGIGGG